jgi:hypothetical protein
MQSEMNKIEIIDINALDDKVFFKHRFVKQIKRIIPIHQIALYLV